MERSIRPFKISRVTLNGSDASLEMQVVSKTYYQPEKRLEVSQKVVTNGATKKTVTVKKVAK
jgi:hypothetical protein